MNKHDIFVALQIYSLLLADALEAGDSVAAAQGWDRINLCVTMLEGAADVTADDWKKVGTLVTALEHMEDAVVAS